MIEKKTQAAMQAQQERNRMNTELTELKDHMDIKDRKINVLQRKVSGLEFFFSFFFLSTSYMYMCIYISRWLFELKKKLEQIRRDLFLALILKFFDKVISVVVRIFASLFSFLLGRNLIIDAR